MQIDQHVSIKVAEPWNFSSPEGNNIFSGVVLDYTNSLNGGAYLIKTNKTFILNGISVNYVTAIYRDKHKDNRMLNIAAIPEGIVNQFRKIDSISDKLKFIIIGSVI